MICYFFPEHKRTEQGYSSDEDAGIDMTIDNMSETSGQSDLKSIHDEAGKILKTNKFKHSKDFHKYSNLTQKKWTWKHILSDLWDASRDTFNIRVTIIEYFLFSILKDILYYNNFNDKGMIWVIAKWIHESRLIDLMYVCNQCRLFIKCLYRAFYFNEPLVYKNITISSSCMLHSPLSKSLDVQACIVKLIDL